MTADELRKLRVQSGKTRQSLADLLGYSANYIYLLESGRKPITEELGRRLEKITGLDNLAPSALPSATQPAAPCRSPDDYDLKADLAEVREELHNLMAQKDAEIVYLRAQLAAAIERIPKP